MLLNRFSKLSIIAIERDLSNVLNNKKIFLLHFLIGTECRLDLNCNDY
jgi:hypothetical protein